MVVVVGVVRFVRICHDHLAAIRIAAHDTHVLLAGHNHQDLAFPALDLFALHKALWLRTACAVPSPCRSLGDLYLCTHQFALLRQSRLALLVEAVALQFQGNLVLLLQCFDRLLALGLDTSDLCRDRLDRGRDGFAYNLVRFQCISYSFIL